MASSPSYNDIPSITTTAATPSTLVGDSEANTYFYTPRAATAPTTSAASPSAEAQALAKEREYFERHNRQQEQDDDEEKLQPNQRRAVDSVQVSHNELAAAPGLQLALSDPRLAITQMSGGRRSSIASIHSNMTSTSASLRRQQQRMYMDEKKNPDGIMAHESNDTANATVMSEGPMDGKVNLTGLDEKQMVGIEDMMDGEDDAPPMDTSWYGYVIVVCSFTIYFIVFGIEHTFGVYQEYYTSPSAEPWLRGIENQKVAMIGTLATTFTYLLGAFSGRFADRAGYRISAVMGAVIMGVGMIGASFAKNLATLYIFQGIILGIGSSLVYLPAVSCPAHWYERYRSIVIGIVVCGSGLGGLVLGPLTELLIRTVGVQWTLRIEGILCLVGIGGSGMLLKTRVKKTPGVSKRVPMDFTICKEVPFQTLAIANFLTSLGYMIPFFFLSAFAVFHKQTPQTGALMIGLLNGASLVGRLTLGFITDRVGRINMLFICALVSGLSILCIWSVASTVKVITVFAVIYGFTCGGYFSVIPSVIAEIYGLDRLTTVTGLLYGSIGVGYLIGSPVSAVLLDITKPETNYIYVVIFSGTTMTLSSLAIFYLKYWRSNGRWWIHG
ncbi:hypothetical protein BGW38_004963 [Lunasporangiospora selenospora]|uniref:Major facilitator superfamily (MFS) profile domain-containing protein n=1 Tax=Lunasporangiospora selenospora TaxID=979761 RepID=A0A9P6KBN7_9FUNG|nr:hypothetical protein BGW38_004963 [Lunasporangiospora selenospora]